MDLNKTMRTTGKKSSLLSSPAVIDGQDHMGHIYSKYYLSNKKERAIFVDRMTKNGTLKKINDEKKYNSIKYSNLRNYGYGMNFALICNRI